MTLPIVEVREAGTVFGWSPPGHNLWYEAARVGADLVAETSIGQGHERRIRISIRSLAIGCLSATMRNHRAVHWL